MKIQKGSPEKQKWNKIDGNGNQIDSSLRQSMF